MCGFKTSRNGPRWSSCQLNRGPQRKRQEQLTDAIRYCLGEQSTGTLQATRMEELVFAGTLTASPPL